MLNTVILDGYVTRKMWRVGPDLFFRLAVYRDPDRPRKEPKNGNGKDSPDYLTIRLRAGVALVSGPLQPGQRIQVHGWLESRHYEETLEEFLKKAQISPEEIGLDANIAVERTTTWICAERIVPLPERNGKRYGKH